MLARIRDVLLQTADETVRLMLVNPEPPHHTTQNIYLVANMADLVFGTGVLTSVQERSLQAQMAFMAYVLDWRG